MTELNSFDRISQPLRDYLTSRAGNYDYATARDLYADIPSELYGNEPAMMSFLRGNEDLGVEPREWMHVQSEANGGLDVPENLVLGPKDLNREIGRADMTDADLAEVASENAETVDVLLQADPQVLVDAMPEVFESTTTVLSVASGEPTVVEQWVGQGRGARVEEVLLESDPSTIPDPSTFAQMDVGPAAEVAEAGLGELIGEAILDGMVPAIFAAKAAGAIADQCETTEDKLGYGALGAGGTVLLYANPVTGPIAWGLTGIYSAVKLVQLGAKVVDHCSKQQASA